MNTQSKIQFKTGVLMPLSSLPSEYGVGDFGFSAYTFIHLLKKMNMNLWQFLPLNALGYGNSPYQTYSSFAMDEVYLDLEDLAKKSYLSFQDLKGYQIQYAKRKAFLGKKERVDFEWVRTLKKDLIVKASETFYQNLEKKHFQDKDFFAFLQKEEWLLPYALFLSAKRANDLKSWLEWQSSLKENLLNFPFSDFKKILTLKEYLRFLIQNLKSIEDKEQYPLILDVKNQIFVQYFLQKQFLALKKFANAKGIQLVGDLPIYLGIDSAEVFYNQSEFLLDEKGNPTFVAGVPPDYFSQTGQRWGNPLYNWEKMESNQFEFWKKRFAYQLRCFDQVRVDHFRAFDTFYKIPASSPDATVGEWVLAPGYALFDTLQKYFGTFEILAEDLGDLRPEVLTLRDHYGFKGMQILQFDFDKPEDRPNSLLYTGTHDNETLKQWFNNLSLEQQKLYRKTIKSYQPHQSLGQALIRYALDSQAEICILPYADLLFLGEEARLNFPGKLIPENWTWKLKSFRALIPKLKKMRFFVKKYRV